MKKAYEIPPDRRISLLNTGETVETSGGAYSFPLGIRVDKGLILAFEEHPDGEKTYFHLLREVEDGTYEYYAADMDFSVNPYTGTICHRTLYCTTMTGRLPVVDIDLSIGEVRVRFNPKKLTLDDVLGENRILGQQIEFSTEDAEFRGTIAKIEREHEKLTFDLNPVERRNCYWNDNVRELLVGNWHLQDEGRSFDFQPALIREEPNGKVSFATDYKRATITFAQKK